MGLMEKIASALGVKQDEAVEGPSGGPHPAPPEQTVDDPAQPAERDADD